MGLGSCICLVKGRVRVRVEGRVRTPAEVGVWRYTASARCRIFVWMPTCMGLLTISTSKGGRVRVRVRVQVRVKVRDR